MRPRTSRHPAALAPIVALLALLALLVLVAGDAGARAGGGEGYSGGGGGGSSYSGGGSSYDGSGGGGGGGEVPSPLLLLVIPLVLLIDAYTRRQSRREQRERMAQDRTRAKQGSARRAAPLRLRDPDFDPERFLDRVSGAFVRIQAAWSAQDLEPVRAWLSDGVAERFSVQLQEQRERGFRNRVEDVEVLVREIVEVESREHFDAVAVKVRARARDERVDLRSGKVLGERSSIKPQFVEVWSFLRPRGSRSGSGRGLLENACPGCSSPLDRTRSDCASCGAALVGAPRDWMLCEITQSGEWQQRRGGGAFDAKRVRARDPGFSLEHLEDRASLLFWRWRDAVRRGDVSRLVSAADPRFVEAERTRLEGSTRVLADCAVGSVRTVGILDPPAEAAGGMERAVVAVRWAGTRFYRGRFEKSHGESRRESWLVLGRRAGTRSDLGRGLATSRCTACGGPDAGESAACVWCGERLNDGSRDWVLLEVVAPNTQAARALEAELSEDRTEAATRGEGAVSAGGLLAWAVALCASDGRIAPRERRALHRLAEIVGVERARLARWIQAALRGELECEQPGAGEAAPWCAALEQIASADGELHRRERQLLARLAARASG